MMPLRLVLLTIAIVTAACSGGGPTTTPSSPSPPPVSNPSPSPPIASTPTVTITPNGMIPLDITIDVGQRVLFVNADVRSHDIVGGVDPSHPECPEIQRAGFLLVGQSRETGTFTSARKCEYHDHTELSVPAFQGRIFIK